MTQSDSKPVRELDANPLIDLDSPTAKDAGMVGSKAAHLALMRTHGLPVPPGVVVTADIDASLAAAEIARRFPDQPVAVRSSSTAEDLATASYAGQYTTVLAAAGEREVADAISEVRASAADPKRRGYDTESGRDMAVLVMPMVDADVAGVMFTTNPVTGDDEMVIEAVAGLGESLVSGQATPQRWIVSGGVSRPMEGSEVPALLDEKATGTLTALAERVVAVAGPHQDIEWARAEGEIHLLQVRPITALPVAPDEELPGPSEIWIRADENYSGPVRPLEYAVWAPILEETARKVFEEMGAPIETMRYRSIGGWMYMRIVPPMDRGKDDSPPPPPWLFGLAMRLVPRFRAKLKRAAAVWSSDLAERAIADWESGGRDQMRETARNLRAVDLEHLDDQELHRHLDHVIDHVQAASDIHFRLPALAMWLPMGHLGVLCEELLGWPAERVAGLVQGSASVVGGRAGALVSVVQTIREDGEGRQLFADDPISLLDHHGPAARALRAFLDEHGHEIVGMDLTHPTWHEDPRPLLTLIGAHLSAQSAAPKENLVSVEVEREALEELDPVDIDHFREVLRVARRGAHYGDETERDVLEALGLIRYVGLEMGRRMAKRDLIADPDGVFYLDLDECRSGLAGENLTEIALRRRREFAWATAHPGPERYGPEPPASPSLKYVPRPARRFMESVMWVMNQVEGVRPDDDVKGDVEAIRGIAASPGRSTGRVRIIRDPSQFDRVESGDVLICPATTASWSVIFPLITAIVTERGGPLSHPGILAREYGIPAVLAVPGATGLFHDGETIEVNGSDGTVAAGPPSPAFV